ncbi:hypothetical protein DFH09DRAFT_1096997 [Mycena vulgaris]|nr:hypothetical protein DFH09DRAFT_1096997 [Mycena vulgaris]
MLANKDLANDVCEHLQELGKFITVEKLVDYLSQEDVMDKHGLDKKISIHAARRYLNGLSYCFTLEKKGQYSDGSADKNESVEDSKNRESLLVCQELTLPSSAKLDGPDPEHERRVCSIEAGRREAQMFQLWIARSIRTQGTPGSSGDEDEAQKSQTGVTLPRAKLAWRASQRGDRKPQMGVVRRKKGEKEVRNKIFPLNEKVIQ